MSRLQHPIVPGYGYMLADTFDIITNLGANVHRQQTVPGRFIGMMVGLAGLSAPGRTPLAVYSLLWGHAMR